MTVFDFGQPETLHAPHASSAVSCMKPLVFFGMQVQHEEKEHERPCAHTRGHKSHWVGKKGVCGQANPQHIARGDHEQRNQCNST